MQVSLFVAGAVFVEVQVPLFPAVAVFDEVQVSLSVAGAVFRMIAGARNVFFSIQNARGEREKYPRLRVGLRTGGFMLGMVSAAHCRFRCFQEIFLTFWTVIFRDGRSIW